MGRIPHEKLLVDQRARFAAKAIGRPVHHTPLKQEAVDIPGVDIESFDINLDSVLEGLYRDIDFHVTPGLIGTLIPAADMWGRNKKLARLQEYVSRTVLVMNDLKALAATQHEMRAKRMVNYEVATLKLSLAKMGQEVLALQNANSVVMQELRERVARMEREHEEAMQRMRIELEAHQMTMEERRIQNRVKELNAQLTEKKLED